jgi:hypothetical protein
MPKHHSAIVGGCGGPVRDITMAGFCVIQPL